MRTLAFITLALYLFSCSSTKHLNMQIYAAQKQALETSPYQTAGRISTEINVQKNFRQKRLPPAFRQAIFKADSKDTVLLLESYDEICLGCLPYRMQVLHKDTVYQLESTFNNKTKETEYLLKKKEFQPDLYIEYDQFDYSEFIEVYNKIKNGISWTENSLVYGSDQCLDGDHTMVTALYPNGKIESIYVRCWLPPAYRNMK